MACGLIAGIIIYMYGIYHSSIIFYLNDEIVLRQLLFVLSVFVHESLPRMEIFLRLNRALFNSDFTHSFLSLNFSDAQEVRSSLAPIVQQLR